MQGNGREIDAVGRDKESLLDSISPLVHKIISQSPVSSQPFVACKDKQVTYCIPANQCLPSTPEFSRLVEGGHLTDGGVDGTLCGTRRKREPVSSDSTTASDMCNQKGSASSSRLSDKK